MSTDIRSHVHGSSCWDFDGPDSEDGSYDGPPIDCPFCEETGQDACTHRVTRAMITPEAPTVEPKEGNTRLRFEQRFDAGFYPIVDGQVRGANGIGADTADAAVRDYFSNYAWPAGYPIVYVLDGDTICGDCALRIWQGEYSDDPDSVVDVAGVETESTYDVVCGNCNRLIAEMTWCEECSSSDHLVTETITNSVYPDGIEYTHCARCAGDVDDTPRYHVISGTVGSMPDNHTGDDGGEPFNTLHDAAMYALDEAHQWADAHGLPECAISSTDGQYYQIARVPYISDTALPFYVEVVPAN